MLEDYDGGEHGIVCGVAEFKAQAGSWKAHFSQIFADMMGIGSLLATNALMRGKIIDKMMVYGLLLDYKNMTGTVVKYYVNFNSDESIFFIGEEINAVKGFIGIVRALKTANY